MIKEEGNVNNIVRSVKKKKPLGVFEQDRKKQTWI